MKYDPEKHHRRSIRMKGFDYRQDAAYFVTLVAQGRECVFGEIMDGAVHLSVTGEIVQSAWLGLRSRFPGIELDEFVIMRNHFHAIIVAVGVALVAAHDGDAVDSRAETSPAPTAAQSNLPVGATLVVAHDGVAAQNDSTPDSRTGTNPAPTINPGLGDVIGAFKSISTHDIILAVRRGDLPSFAGKIWQRNYYEHIIRDDQEWERIAQYIGANPTCWEEDAENPRR